MTKHKTATKQIRENGSLQIKQKKTKKLELKPVVVKRNASETYFRKGLPFIWDPTHCLAIQEGS